MEKRIAFLLFIFFIMCLFSPSFAKEKEIKKVYYPQEMIEVELLFSHQTVTTRTLMPLLKQQGFILSFSYRNTLSYVDASMEKKLSHLYSPKIEEYEKAFQKTLEEYGFFEESERIHRTGILLEKVTVRIPYAFLEELTKLEGIKVKL